MIYLYHYRFLVGSSVQWTWWELHNTKSCPRIFRFSPWKSRKLIKYTLISVLGYTKCLWGWVNSTLNPTGTRATRYTREVDAKHGFSGFSKQASRFRPHRFLATLNVWVLSARCTWSLDDIRYLTTRVKHHIHTHKVTGDIQYDRPNIRGKSRTQNVPIFEYFTVVSNYEVNFQIFKIYWCSECEIC